MSSSGISELILFIGAISIAATVATTLMFSFSQFSDDIETASSTVSEELLSDITIISDGKSDFVYNNSTDELRILIKNTGGNTLKINNTNILVDGKFYSYDSTKNMDGNSEWRKGDVVLYTIKNISLSNGEHTIVARISAASDRFVMFEG